MTDVLVRDLFRYFMHEDDERLLRPARDRNLGIDIGLEPAKSYRFPLFYLFVKPCSGDFVESLFEDGLVIFRAGKFKKDPGGSFCQAKWTFEIHFFAY